MNTRTLNTVAPVATEKAIVPISMGNIVGALALVLLLIVAVAWVLRRTGIASRVSKGGNHILSVKQTLAIGTRERLVVVEVDDKWLLLGVTQENITHLLTTDKKEEDAATPLTTGFQASLLNCIRQRAAGSQQ